MKKHLIAAAVAAAIAAPAMAQVTIYGVIDMGYSDEKKSQIGVEAQNTGINTSPSSTSAGINRVIGGSSGLSSSRLGFRGAEDLGNGLKADFVLETGLNQGNGSFLFGGTNRAANVGLSGSFGEVRIGRMNTIGKTINDTYSAFGGGASFEQGSIALESVRGAEMAGTLTYGGNTAYGTGSTGTPDRTTALFASTQIAAIADRTSNGLTYTSPRFGGFQVGAMYATAEYEADSSDAQKTEAKAMGVTVSYANGPLSIHVGTSKADLTDRFTVAAAQAEDTTKDKVSLNQIGARYAIGPATLFALYNQGEFKSGTASEVTLDTKGYDIGATYTVGPWTLLASFGQGAVDEALGAAADSEPAAATTKSEADLKGHQLQARYALSKRTTAYVMYGQTKVDRDTRAASATQGAVLADGKSTVSMIGLRHSF